MYGYETGPQEWLLMLLMMTAMTVLTVVAVVAVVRSLRRPDDRDGARQVLDRRYAGGELSTEEYQERVAHLPER